MTCAAFFFSFLFFSLPYPRVYPPINFDEMIASLYHIGFKAFYRLRREDEFSTYRCEYEKSNLQKPTEASKLQMPKTQNHNDFTRVRLMVTIQIVLSNILHSGWLFSSRSDGSQSSDKIGESVGRLCRKYITSYPVS